jgi:gas vesicle protein
MNDTSKSAIYLLTGLVAGVTLGILFSPDKGTENREKLTNSLINIGETVRDTAAESIENLMSVATNIVTHFKGESDMYAQYHDDIENAII